MNLLDNINSPDDLKKLKIEELPELCDEIREYLLNTISLVGGHLASNLGSVELTVAMHYVYNSPRDRFCWDVGHQTYVHKILTGRKDRLNTVRTFNGLSGFPRADESEHDIYNTGHAGTAISQAFGEAVARDLKQASDGGRKSSVVAVVGDASIVSGMSFEAMNHAGWLRTPFLTVLNDNEMSISHNVGAISYHLNSLINTRMYRSWRIRFFRLLKYIPFFGPVFERLLIRFGSSMKSIVTDHQFFEELGFRYLGPLDGHDVTKLVKMFQKLQNVEEPILLHVVTRKGKGYHLAEADPVKYHGVTPFTRKTGIAASSGKNWSFSKFTGATLTHLAGKDADICAITPAMIEGSGLQKMAAEHPERLFDAGIAEQHATTFAGALARSGMKPFLCIYSTFLQRGYDQLIHDIALMNLPVRIVIDRAGCVGGDGETHQGLYDIGYMYPVPNLKILTAADASELIQILLFMADYNEGPVSVRFPKKSFSYDIWQKFSENPVREAGFDPFKSETVREGSDVLFITEGVMRDNALKAAELLEEKGVSAGVLSLRSLRPLDLESILNAIGSKKNVFIVENHNADSGIGRRIVSELHGRFSNDVHFTLSGYDDQPVSHGSIADLEKEYGLDAESLCANVLKTTGHKSGSSKNKQAKSA